MSPLRSPLSTAWTMCTVSAVVVIPSPLGIYSFRITTPPGISIVVFGAGVTSPKGTPFTTRPTKPEPSALLAAVTPLPALSDTATALSAVTSPSRMFRRSTSAVLRILDPAVSMEPVVLTVSRPVVRYRAHRSRSIVRRPSRLHAKPPAGAVHRHDGAGAGAALSVDLPRDAVGLLGHAVPSLRGYCGP